MSVQSEIERIKANVVDSFAAVGEKGGTLPETQNSDSLPAAIRSISGEELATYIVKAPVGAILWWSGPADTIPPGWHICDGEAGTLDLRDQFILAAGPNHPAGETGGSEEVTLTVEQMPTHKHAIDRKNNGVIGAKSTFILNSDGDTGGTAISASGVYSSGGDEPHPNMPPYKSLYAIQKIAPDETGGAIYEAGDGVKFTTDGDKIKIGLDCPVKPVTNAEYEALTEEQKNANVAYLIVDADE